MAVHGLQVGAVAHCLTIRQTGARIRPAGAGTRSSPKEHALTTHICDLTPSGDDPDSARALLHRHGLPEDVIDGVLALYAQEMAAWQRNVHDTMRPGFHMGQPCGPAFDCHVAKVIDTIDPTRADVPAAPSAAVSPPPATDRAALREQVAEALLDHLSRTADIRPGRNSDLAFMPEVTDGERMRITDAVLAVLPPDGQAAEVEPPLSPDYEHPACGFHWHGKDGMDIPVRDGEPVCPRCELARVEKLLAHREKRCEELRAESKRRGKVKLEYAEKIRAQEREIDEVRRQLGAEILRAGQAETELRRLAAGERDEQQAQDEAPEEVLDLTDGPVRCPLCPHPVTLHTPGGARAHFTHVHPEQRITGRGPGPWPLLVTDGDEERQGDGGQPDGEVALLRLTVDAIEEGRRELRSENARLRAQLWTLAAALDGLHTLIATSSRDWGPYRVDAWLWAVLVGWDCEEAHEHDELCEDGAAMREMADRHGWDEATVAKARRYRAAVRTLTGTAAAPVAGQPPADTGEETVHGCPPDDSGLTPCCGRTPFELPRTDRISSEVPVTCKGADRG